MATKKQDKKLRITLVRSLNGRLQSQKDCVRGLGLRKINHTVEREDTPSIRGMVNKVSFLLNVEEI